MKKLFLFIIFVLFSFLQSSQTAFAHVIKSDGPIEVLLHINPDDNLIAGQQSEFFFSIQDKQNKFFFKDCACGVEISKNNKIIQSGNLSPNSTDQHEGIFAYVFPEKAVYQIKLTGRPIEENTFQPFTVSYDIRVDRSLDDNFSSVAQSLIIFSLIVISVVFCIILFAKKKKRRSKI
jgi:hypothetical protein